MTFVANEALHIPVDGELALRQLTEADAHIVTAAVQNSRDHLSQFESAGVLAIFPNLEATRRRIRYQGEAHKLLGMWAKEKFAGVLALSIFEMPPTERICTVSYWTAADQVMHGYASHALEAGADYALQERGVDLVRASVQVGNVASAATAQKAGLRYMRTVGHRSPNQLSTWIFDQYKEVPEEYQDIFSNDVLKSFMLKHSDRRSIAWVKLNGVNKPTINHGSDTTYYVQSGEATFVVDDEIETAKAGDQIHVPCGTKYQDVGRATMLAVCEPGFDARQIEVVRPSTSNHT